MIYLKHPQWNSDAFSKNHCKYLCHQCKDVMMKFVSVILDHRPVCDHQNFNKILRWFVIFSSLLAFQHYIVFFFFSFYSNMNTFVFCTGICGSVTFHEVMYGVMEIQGYRKFFCYLIVYRIFSCWKERIIKFFFVYWSVFIVEPMNIECY